MQCEIEAEPAVLQFILKVHIDQRLRIEARQIGERQIMCADQANGAFFEQGADDALSSHAPVGRVRTLQKFIQQKQQRQGRGLKQLPQVGDLGVEARTAFMQGVVDANAGADLQGSQFQTMGAHRSAGHGEHRVDADGAQQGALA